MKHVVDLEPTAARASPHDDVAGRAADAPGRPKAGEQASNETTISATPVARHGV